VKTLAIATQLTDPKKKAQALEHIATSFERAGPGGNFTQLQFSIGWMYHEGRNLPKDPARAAAWYRKAATAGHAQAQINLATIHMQGEGGASNHTEAAKWFSQAAEQGDAEGQVALGMLYALGRGVESDLVQANKWITLAAEQGNDEAKAALAQLSTKLTPSQLAESQKLAKEWQAKHGAKPSAADSGQKPSKTAKN